MATDEILRTYGDSSRKEDVLGIIEILTATENSILNKLGKTKAIDMVHITLTDTLRTTATRAVGEGADYTALALTTPTRVQNVVEHVAVPFKVSRAQQKIEHYHGDNELARQTKKALLEWHNAAEFDLVRSTLVSGASGTTPKMSGIIQAISKSTNYTSHNSGTAWSASILKGLMVANWDNSNGDVATELYMGSFLKDKTDDFTTKTNVVNYSTDQKTIVQTTTNFETGFGKVSIYPHRYVQQSGDATARVLGIRPEKLKVAYLEAPYIDTGLARSGPYDFRAVVGYLTLETRNQDSNFYADGFDKD